MTPDSATSKTEILVPLAEGLALPVRGPAVTPRLRGLINQVSGVLDWLFGLFSLVIVLAVLSVVPVLNVLSLGYLVHASGRVAATGKFRHGFVGMRKASIVGSVVIGSWLVFLPVRIISSLWKDVELTDPGGASVRTWGAVVLALTLLTVAHWISAVVRGGRLQHFLWPAPWKFVGWLRTPGKFETMRNSVLEYLSGLRLPYYFSLGLRGFLGAIIWLILPVGLLVMAGQLAPNKGGAVLSLLGGLLLAPVVLYLPFLQTRFALENRFRALFELRAIRRDFRHAPVAFWVSLCITLLFALPLYLLKIELPPREIAWLPSLFFVLFIFPARLLTGWAISRAIRREQPRHAFFRWTSRLAFIPVVTAYVLFVYLTQYLSWNGSFSLFEQHAFLVPAPLISL